MGHGDCVACVLERLTTGVNVRLFEHTLYTHRHTYRTHKHIFPLWKLYLSYVHGFFYTTYKTIVAYVLVIVARVARKTSVTCVDDLMTIIDQS